MPLPLQLSIAFLVGVALGGIANWAIYRLAWNRREISPWGPAPEGTTRRPVDRLPVIGWFGLRRESTLHGAGFWIRPMIIELFMGLGMAALYWWEIKCHGLLAAQVSDLLGTPVQLTAGAVRPSILWWTLLSHTLLVTLMVAASFIDIDEKIIPDEITVPGTILGLLLATLLPLSLLPQVTPSIRPPKLSAPIELPPQAAARLKAGTQLYLEPMTVSAPNAWPVILKGAPKWQSLAVGQACWWLWCFALAPRIWRGRRGPLKAIALIVRRVIREFLRPPLGAIAWPGSVAIALAWWWGSAAWTGLLTSLVGLAMSGGMIWAVRLVGTAALRREAMGFGDVTLMMMVGTFVGWQASVVTFFVAAVMGVVVGLLQAVLLRDDEIPYGPSLCLGTLVVVVSWAYVWNNTWFAFHFGMLVPAVMIGCVLLMGPMLVAIQPLKRLFLKEGEDQQEDRP